MGAVTVYAVYNSARAVLPESIGFAVLAGSLTAFNPMFIFKSASVSNDNMVTMLAALITWQMLLMLRAGFQTRRSLTLASLAKLSGLVVGAVAALAGLYVFIRSRDRRGFVTLGVLMLGVWLAISGWWFTRNLALYGELFGTGAMLEHFGRRSQSLQSLLFEEFEGLRISFWALFGAFSILTHKLFYLAMDGLSILGVTGLIIALVRKRQPFLRAAVAFLGIALALGGAMLIWWTLQTTASTGRLLFPYITSISALLALGLHTLRIPAPLVALPMFLFAFVCPFVYIMPQYDHPPTVVDLPDSASRTYVRWDDITIIGYQIPPPGRWSAGDEIPLTLYWQPLAQSSEMKALFITLIDADGEALATIDSFPGWGTLPTTWWQPSSIYRDDYILQIPGDAKNFSNVQLHIGWYDWETRKDILPKLESGAESTAFTLPIGALVDGQTMQELGNDSTADGTVFGDVIKLNAYSFTAGHILNLEWLIVGEVSGDWRAFAIVLAEPYQDGAEFEIMMQKDTVPPVRLDLLNVDETFITRHAFVLPAGYRREHGIYVGWYNDDLNIRLLLPFSSNMLLLENALFNE